MFIYKNTIALKTGILFALILLTSCGKDTEKGTIITKDDITKTIFIDNTGDGKPDKSISFDHCKNCYLPEEWADKHSIKGSGGYVGNLGFLGWGSGKGVIPSVDFYPYLNVGDEIEYSDMENRVQSEIFFRDGKWDASKIVKINGKYYLKVIIQRKEEIAEIERQKRKALIAKADSARQVQEKIDLDSAYARMQREHWQATTPEGNEQRKIDEQIQDSLRKIQEEENNARAMEIARRSEFERDSTAKALAEAVKADSLRAKKERAERKSKIDRGIIEFINGYETDFSEWKQYEIGTYSVRSVERYDIKQKFEASVAGEANSRGSAHMGDGGLKMLLFPIMGKLAQGQFEGGSKFSGQLTGGEYTVVNVTLTNKQIISLSPQIDARVLSVKPGWNITLYKIADGRLQYRLSR